jgi:hypothetical protein
MGAGTCLLVCLGGIGHIGRAFGCLCSPSSTNKRNRHFDRSCSFAVVVARPLPPTNETVISTEAAHGPTVSSAAEKPASLPKHSPAKGRCRCFFAVAVARSLPPTKETVISTEAAHGLIVSSAAEKPASLPKPHPAKAVAVALCLSSPKTAKPRPNPAQSRGLPVSPNRL